VNTRYGMLKSRRNVYKEAQKQKERTDDDHKKVTEGFDEFLKGVMGSLDTDRHQERCKAIDRMTIMPPVSRGTKTLLRVRTNISTKPPENSRKPLSGKLK
jgi:hypothetical protein